MISTGNDIISLNAINVARTKQPRFYSKILSGNERSLYDEPQFTAIPFEIFVWLLWSIKESAYKFLKRIDQKLIFTPVKFEVTQLEIPAGFSIINFGQHETEGIDFADGSALKGTIAIGTYKLYSRSLIYKQLILSVVDDNKNFDTTCWGIKSISSTAPDTQSAAVREFLLNRLQNALGFKDITINKNPDGIPVLLQASKDTGIPVSLSHHDCVIAYCFKLANQD